MVICIKHITFRHIHILSHTNNGVCLCRTTITVGAGHRENIVHISGTVVHRDMIHRADCAVAPHITTARAALRRDGLKVNEADGGTERDDSGRNRHGRHSAHSDGL